MFKRFFKRTTLSMAECVRMFWSMTIPVVACAITLALNKRGLTV